ncbi:MAG: pseudouridine synthase [Anaerolineales bacterium]
MAAERLHKVLARAGVGSRRRCEALIVEGRVTVNGLPAILGQSVDATREAIRVDGRAIGPAPEAVVVALHKPAGVVSSLNPQGPRRTVRDLVPLPGRLYPAGRLDLHSEGLVILTNDGDLALRLTHPRFEHEKEYRVLLDRALEPAQLTAWQRGMATAAGRPAPARVRRESSDEEDRWIRVVLREGRKRQIRESARSLGLEVRRLIRVRIGGLGLGRIRPGEWRVLSRTEVGALLGKSERGRPNRKGRGTFGRPAPAPGPRGQLRRRSHVDRRSDG